VSLIVVSAYRSDAEQAKLFAQNPDPKWVAPPGQSLHRLGTELDLGPAGAWGWLEASAGRFNFHKRYSWEPWHFGYTLNPGSTSVGFGYGGGERRSTLPSFVPARFVPALSRAAQRWSVSAALLAAQLYAESNFNPFSVSSAGAQGIAQFTQARRPHTGCATPSTRRPRSTPRLSVLGVPVARPRGSVLTCEPTDGRLAILAGRLQKGHRYEWS
jgi:hypothetical protein